MRRREFIAALRYELVVNLKTAKAPGVEMRRCCSRAPIA